MQGKKWMERICRRYSEILGEQLTGIYLHGSAAFGCACDASDLDFIVVVSGAPSQQQKREMIALLLCLLAELSKAVYRRFGRMVPPHERGGL